MGKTHHLDEKERWKLEADWKMAPLKKIQSTKSTASLQEFPGFGVSGLVGRITHRI